jgi:phosphoglycolate phosphatase-like HAD superfamily hydrolase
MHERGADAGTAVAGVLFDMGGTVFGYESRALMGKANGAALRRLGLDPDHDEVREARRIASEEVSRAYAARPSFLHRELFRDRIRRTAELLGVEVGDEVLDRSDVLFVGDSVAHDIVGAHAAGMRAVLIPDDDGPAPLSAGLVDDAEPDHRIESLGELVHIVDELAGHR